MTKLRVWIAATMAWLLLFYNIERFHEPINLASFVYVLAAVAAIAIVALRRRHAPNLTLLIVAALVSLLCLKVMLGYPLFGQHLPITVTEACALVVTVLLVRGIAVSIDEFEAGAADVMTMHLSGKSTPFEAGQVDLYRELRRARHFKRPLALVTLATDGKSTSVPINRFIEEVQRNAIKRYIDARVGQLLTTSMKDCDIIAHSQDHFVVLLPEATGPQADEVVERLRDRARSELGLELQVGAATFPDEEVTLTGLLQRAEKAMRAGGGPARPASNWATERA